MNDNFDTTTVTIEMTKRLAITAVFNAIAGSHEAELSTLIETLETIDDETFAQVLIDLGYESDIEDLSRAILSTIASYVKRTVTKANTKAAGNTATGSK